MSVDEAGAYDAARGVDGVEISPVPRSLGTRFARRVCFPMGRKPPQGAVTFPDSLSIYVGPEGDFSPEELAALIDIATPVSFGSTILRAETAAIYGVSVLKSFLDCR